MLKKRLWHDLNRETNPIGFGCWQIAGNHTANGKPNGWGDIDERKAVALLTRAMSSGIDFYDTAQGYNNGNSEMLLGKAMANAKKRPLICSKIALTSDEITNCNLNDDFVLKVEKSLKRLQTEQIDILLLHNPPDSIDWTSFAQSILIALKEQGKIGTFGVSSISINGAKNAAKANFGSTIEWVFNVFERRPVTELFPLLREKKMNFIARSPLSRGLINPKYITSEPKFDENDFRSTLPGDWVKWGISQLRKMNSNGVESKDIISFSLNYYSLFREVTSTIVGIKTMEQLDAISEIMNDSASQKYLEESVLANIPECYPKWK
ncbi:aldo/keto reductase [Arcticibacterium luteifluviistationis]|uniref:NADP-dependent oxidoreductase domain-containing protein n=1 Tax=Arcticibacterium luteifluviistationis TaxID=1784714 RepID=A0A2Z4G702_9BACT|nr:aldo/keto reductase [Arcticibacterium luteifluviistationis]AWV96914.1 hypothetical protein DJ013_01460 [Arcticibacterium luteifluviistationis]